MRVVMRRISRDGLDEGESARVFRFASNQIRLTASMFPHPPEYVSLPRRLSFPAVDHFNVDVVWQTLLMRVPNSCLGNCVHVPLRALY